VRVEASDARFVGFLGYDPSCEVFSDRVIRELKSLVPFVAIEEPAFHKHFDDPCRMDWLVNVRPDASEIYRQ
jgi:hypothetical protein